MFDQAVREARKHLLKSAKARTVGKYTIRLEPVEDSQNLAVTTWGYDHEEIFVPQKRVDLIRAKIRIQIRMPGLDVVDQVTLRFYLDILRREAKIVD